MYGERATRFFVHALSDFLRIAEEDMVRRGREKMCCPCRTCGNTLMWAHASTLQLHVLTKGFMDGYTRWTSHGEEAEVGASTFEEETIQHEETEGDHEENPVGEDNLTEMLHDVHMAEQVVQDSEDEREIAKFKKLLKDSQTPLYPNCDTEHTRLSVTLELLRIKARHNCPDASFDETLSYLADVFPKDNMLPTSTYEAKKIVCPLGLDVHRFHACPNDCIIYRKEYEQLKKCPTCDTSRYKRGRNEEDDGEEVSSGAPAKVVWYLPVLPRLKRLFGNKKEAKLMR